MRTPREALADILARIERLEETERVPMDRSAGRVLAVDVKADIDLPPFDKSAMDGYAVHAADFSPRAAPEGTRSLTILGESRAGQPFHGDVPAGHCVAIYTGAELPASCDAVIMVEKTEGEGPERVVLRDRPQPLQNVCKRGQDIALGSTVLETGRRLRAVELAVLASVGCDPVTVFRRPRVSVLTSGDELVAPGERPGEGQIRESNTFELTAMSRAAGAEASNLGVVRDDPELLERAFREALDACDLLITTGGVSMGKYDLVGEVLARIGVEAVFHKVAIKPGKPLWFGTWKHVPVFALPGNPVSCLVNHAVFVRPAIERLSGAGGGATVLPRARWGGSDLAPNARERHVPVRVGVAGDGASRLEPVRWNGSADVVGLARADALAVVPIDRSVAPGELLAYRALT